jgi:hypothetical protein
MIVQSMPLLTHKKMKLKRIRRVILTVLFIGAILSSKAQVSYKIISGEKSIYAQNDEINIQLQLTVDPKSCQDGMEKTGIYVSGIKILSKPEWLELKKGLWQITLKCQITGNKKGFGQLTVVRKTDKQDLFKQVKFNIRKNVDFENE